MKKPKRVPIVGAWRINEFSRPSTNVPFRFNRRFLYDTDQYRTQLKTKITCVINGRWYGVECTRFTLEAFDGTTWVQIEEWIGPTPEQRLLRGIKP